MSNYPAGTNDADIEARFGGEDEDFRPLCPNCGKHADFRTVRKQFTETHGLDCGPYETWTDEWLVCSECGAETDEDEVEKMQEEL